MTRVKLALIGVAITAFLMGCVLAVVLNAVLGFFVVAGQFA